MLHQTQCLFRKFTFDNIVNGSYKVKTYELMCTKETDKHGYAQGESFRANRSIFRLFF